MKMVLLWVASITILLTSIFLLLTKGIYCANEGEIVPNGMILNGCCRTLSSINKAPVYNLVSIGNECYKESDLVIDGYFKPEPSWWVYMRYIIHRMKGGKIEELRTTESKNICTFCGNAICDQYEDVCNCSQDCKNSENSNYISWKDYCDKGSKKISSCDNYFFTDTDNILKSFMFIQLPLECACYIENLNKSRYSKKCYDSLCIFKSDGF